MVSPPCLLTFTEPVPSECRRHQDDGHPDYHLRASQVPAPDFYYVYPYLGDCRQLSLSIPGFSVIEQLLTSFQASRSWPLLGHISSSNGNPWNATLLRGKSFRFLSIPFRLIPCCDFDSSEDGPRFSGIMCRILTTEILP